MAASAHHHLFSDESTVSVPSLTTIYTNLVVPLSSSDKDEATRIPQKLDNRAYPEKSLCLVDGHDDNDDDDDDNNDDDSNDDGEHGDGSTEWGGGDVTVEYEGRMLEDSNGLVRCSSAASIRSNYIHGMEEPSGSALGNKMYQVEVESLWSNEKHNYYLDSMEANFVRDMYAHNYCSLELCGNQPQSQSESESEASMVYTGTSSDIMDELDEEAMVVCNPTIIEDMMTGKDALQCTISSSSSSSSSCWGRSGKEKRSRHATTSSSKTNSTKTRISFTSGTSNWQNTIHHCLQEIDIARLHEHATVLTDPIQDSSPSIDSNVKKRAYQVVSCEEERSIKTLKLAGKKHSFLSSTYYGQVVPSLCINSTRSHQDSQDMQGLAKIREGINLESTTKPLTIQ